ncbi:hypothetical protein KIW84_010230 [Lathyrus oleraceus]|nr:hypothetical protein KIW84_010230 [Pisum sativum]
MQMREHMAHIFKFVNVIIIFLFIFVVVTDGNVATDNIAIDGVIKCQSNRECRKAMPDCRRPKYPRYVIRLLLKFFRMGFNTLFFLIFYYFFRRNTCTIKNNTFSDNFRIRFIKGNMHRFFNDK